MESDNATIARLEGQIEWYDEKSRFSQNAFKVCMVLDMVVAAAITVGAPFRPAPWVLATLGGVILVVQGIQHLYQFEHNWNNYRSTCEELKHHKYLYLGKAGPYAEVANPLPLLAENVESLISKEHAQWIVGRREGKKCST